MAKIDELNQAVADAAGEVDTLVQDIVTATNDFDAKIADLESQVQQANPDLGPSIDALKAVKEKLASAVTQIVTADPGPTPAPAPVDTGTPVETPPADQVPAPQPE